VVSQLATILGIDESSYMRDVDIDPEIIDKFGDCLSGKVELDETMNIEHPVLSNALFQIEERIKEETRLPFIKKWYWPNWMSHVITITHDIDKISASRKHVWNIRKRFPFFKVLLHQMNFYNVYENFSMFERFERKKNIRSAFYLLPSDYDVKRIEGKVKKLDRSGWDIGLHGSFGTHEDLEKLKDEKQLIDGLIDGNVHGNRFHFLKFSYPESWGILERAGFAYDTTCGSSTHVGFRNGFPFPFFPPSDNWDTLRIVEIPLQIMDATLWTYKKFTESEALEFLRKNYSLIKQQNGMFSLLWHYGVLNMKGGRIYPEILEFLDTSKVLTAREIADWWNKRNDCNITINKKHSSHEVRIYTSDGDLAGIGLQLVTDLTVKKCSSNVKIMNMENNIGKLLITGNSEARITLE